MRKNTNVALNALALGLVGLCAIAPARAATVVWGLDWTTNGVASTGSSNIVLTQNAGDQRGSAWVTSPLDPTVTPGFSAHFAFRISGTGTPGDGMAFVIQNWGTDALGDESAGGSGLGYEGLSGTLLAVEFDTVAFDDEFDPESPAPHVAIQPNNLNVTNHVDGVVVGVQELGLVGSTRYAWVDFDSDSNILKVFLDDEDIKPIDPILFYALGDSLAGYFNYESVFYGFTAATGALTSQHEVLDFSMTPVPLPAAAWLLLSGLLGVGVIGRRSAAGKAA